MAISYADRENALLRTLPHIRDYTPDDQYLPAGLTRDSQGIIRGQDNIPYARWMFNEGNGIEYWYTPDAQSSEFISMAKGLPSGLVALLLTSGAVASKNQSSEPAPKPMQEASQPAQEPRSSSSDTPGASRSLAACLRSLWHDFKERRGGGNAPGTL